jgi:hypothetical protein
MNSIFYMALSVLIIWLGYWMMRNMIRDSELWEEVIHIILHPKHIKMPTKESMRSFQCPHNFTYKKYAVEFRFDYSYQRVTFFDKNGYVGTVRLSHDNAAHRFLFKMLHERYLGMSNVQYRRKKKLSNLLKNI